MTPSLIRVVIADDHPVLRQGIRGLLQNYSQIQIVGEASTGAEALHLVEELKPDVLLLDVTMSELSGVEVAEQLHQRRVAVRILILTASDKLEHIRRFVDAGVAGYLLKEEASWTIAQAIEAIARGESGWYSRRIQEQLGRLPARSVPTPYLTPREIEVLRQVVRGMTNAAISHVLNISEKTVEKHLDSIYRKLGATSRTEAAVTAVQQDLV